MNKSSVFAVDPQPPIPDAGISPRSCRYSPKMATILVVDDESLIRWSLTESFEAQGFTVFEAGSGREAVACLGQHGDIGVVLLDLKLPDSTDLTLLRRLRRLAPGARVILMTAHGTAEILDEAVRAGAFRAIGKPFDMNDMVKIVRDAVVV
jgi:two-component system, NtrC family, nitrogen regulation response regulator GlnG